MSATRSAVAKAEVSTVWSLLSDLQRWHEWNPNLEKIMWEDGQEPAFENGTTCVFCLTRASGGHRCDGQIYNITPSEKFTFELQLMGGLLVIEGSFQLEASSDTEDNNSSGTKVTYKLGVEGFMGPLMSMCYKANIIIAVEEGLAKLVETVELEQRLKK